MIIHSEGIGLDVALGATTSKTNPTSLREKMKMENLTGIKDLTPRGCQLATVSTPSQNVSSIVGVNNGINQQPQPRRQISPQKNISFGATQKVSGLKMAVQEIVKIGNTHQG